MKKKILMALLVTAMTVSMITGCGSRMEGDGKVQAAMADAGNSQEESSDVPESEANEAESSEQTPEPTVEPTPEATAEPTAEPASEAVNTTDAGTADGSSENTAVKDEVTGYTFTEMEETMYAKCTVNCRNLPTTDNSEKIGKLTGGQEVKVTGQCVETQWYRIELEDESVAYVSNNYIVKDKSQVAGSSSTSNSGKTTGGNKTGNATQSGSKTGSTSGTSTQGGNTQTTSTQQSTSSGQSSSFVDYLNQQRAAAGLSQVSWDSNLASIASNRAVAISTNFEHDYSYNDLENLLSIGSSSITDWYNQWYNSDVHRATMMNSNAVSAGCAYYEVDGYYYVVLVVHTEVKVQSAEEWKETTEQGVEDGSITVSEGSEGSGVTVYAQTEGYEEITDPEEQADLQAAFDAAFGN